MSIFVSQQYSALLSLPTVNHSRPVVVKVQMSLASEGSFHRQSLDHRCVLPCTRTQPKHASALPGRVRRAASGYSTCGWPSISSAREPCQGGPSLAPPGQGSPRPVSAEATGCPRGDPGGQSGRHRRRPSCQQVPGPSLFSRSILPLFFLRSGFITYIEPQLTGRSQDTKFPISLGIYVTYTIVQ
jgi:hypothetical protein